MGIRVIKTAIAAIAAIYTAHYFDLQPALAAGILAILGVEVSRMKGLQSVAIRFIASVLGLFFASLIFTIFGFYYWVVALFILITFPVLSRFHLKDGILTSAVIVFHLFDYGQVSTAIITNEVFLLFVGLGWATVINVLYMPREEGALGKFRLEVDENLSSTFYEMAANLKDPNYIWSGQELLVIHEAIEAGVRHSELHKQNRIWGYESYWLTYFMMRRQQLEIIQQMLGELAYVYEKCPQGDLIADLLEQLSIAVKSDVYEGAVENRVLELHRSFRSMDLPHTREEFEVRAALFTLLHEIERYLQIAKRLKKKSSLVHSKG